MDGPESGQAQHRLAPPPNSALSSFNTASHAIKASYHAPNEPATPLRKTTPTAQATTHSTTPNAAITTQHS